MHQDETLSDQLGWESTLLCESAESWVMSYLLGRCQYSYDFRVEVCYSVHVASVRTMIPWDKTASDRGERRFKMQERQTKCGKRLKTHPSLYLKCLKAKLTTSLTKLSRTGCSSIWSMTHSHMSARQQLNIVVCLSIWVTCFRTSMSTREKMKSMARSLRSSRKSLCCSSLRGRREQGVCT